MDFSFSEEQEALRELARKILAENVTQERLKALERSGEWFDLSTWRQLADAKLLGVAVPEAYGGSGLGVIELCLLLEEVGRHVAPVPVLASLALGALPLAEFGSEEQKRRLLAPAAAGDTILTAALIELGSDDPASPKATARRDGNTWRLDGIKVTVPAGTLARQILVPAQTGAGEVGVFVVDAQAPGVKVTPQLTTNGEPHGRLELNGAVVGDADVLGDPRRGAAIARWIEQRALLAYCAVQVGVCDRVLRMTAEYTTGREQFGKPIATFQAVQQRAADAYIDLEAIRLTTWQAAFRMAEGLPSDEEIIIAKFWAAEGGQHVAVATQHLHGGIGVDIDYPLHRYFVWSKHVELTLGSASHQLARLGARMAR